MTVNLSIFEENNETGTNLPEEYKNVLNLKIQGYRRMTAEEYLKEKLREHKLFLKTT